MLVFADSSSGVQPVSQLHSEENELQLWNHCLTIDKNNCCNPLPASPWPASQLPHCWIYRKENGNVGKVQATHIKDRQFISMSSLVSFFTFGQIIQSLQSFFFLLSWQYLQSFWQPLSSLKKWVFASRVGGGTCPFKESLVRCLVQGAAGDF